MLRNLNKTGALFYPSSGLNWQPLHSFRNVCRLFIYCDWSTRWTDFNAAINQLEYPSFAEKPFLYMRELVEAAIKRRIVRLPYMTNLPWPVVTPDGLPIKPWCEMAKLIFRDGDAIQPVWMLFIAGNAVQCYRKIFSRNHTAPKFVYLRRPAGVPVDAWDEFVAADGPLATVIHHNPRRPLHVLNDIGEAALE
ncbi:MAG: hypothetical protein WAO21_02080 [Verrucomicrobiia bacterium]